VWFVRAFALGERQSEKSNRTHRKGITCRAVSPVLGSRKSFSETGAASRGSDLAHCALGATCSTFIDTCFNYPSLSDLYKYAAYDALGRVDRGDVYRPWAPARPPALPL